LVGSELSNTLRRVSVSTHQVHVIPGRPGSPSRPGGPGGPRGPRTPAQHVQYTANSVFSFYLGCATRVNIGTLTPCIEAVA